MKVLEGCLQEQRSYGTSTMASSSKELLREFRTKETKSIHSEVVPRLREIQRNYKVGLSRSKLKEKYKVCTSLYSGIMLHTDQAVPVQERNKSCGNSLGRRHSDRTVSS